jgi:hypothetical protein
LRYILPEEPAEGRLKEAAGLAAINGFRALAEDVLKDAINGARKAMLVDAEAKNVAAVAALAEAEKVKDKNKLAEAKLRHFEVMCNLEDIRYRQKELAETPPEPAPDKAENADNQMGILDISEIMNDLIANQKITKKREKLISGNRVIDAEYWIKTNVDDVLCYLQKKYPRLDAEEFMRKHLKGKRGGHIGNSFRVKKSINRR